MSENQISIAHMFTVPVAVHDIPDCAPLNAELTQFLLSREQPQYANQPLSPQMHKGVFESVTGVLQWQEPCVEKLRAAVMATVARVVAEISGYGTEELTRLGVLTQSRFHVMRRGGGTLAHNQAMASWSAVYCVSPGDTLADHPESGSLCVLDPRVPLNSYVDPREHPLATAIRVRASLGQAASRAAGDLPGVPAARGHDLSGRAASHHDQCRFFVRLAPLASCGRTGDASPRIGSLLPSVFLQRCAVGFSRAPRMREPHAPAQAARRTPAHDCKKVRRSRSARFF